MASPDYRGARGSNAGDDFHELWAVRQALKLLDPNSNLFELTVEGLKSEDENGLPEDTWDGVDCAFYYKNTEEALIEKIEIAQMKYSSANPGLNWTITRLTKSKKKSNSIIGKLAKAYIGIKEKYPYLIENKQVIIKLISNQNIDPNIIKILSDKNESNSELILLRSASGMNSENFVDFIECLDFSDCGIDSRFAVEERVLALISEWIEDDARVTLDTLMRFVRKAMMPEAKGKIISKHDILINFGFSDQSALFPCRPVINEVKNLIVRETSKEITRELIKGKQRICLYGEGGCGKTTTIQEIKTLLPPDSQTIIFDCYGGGRYLDSDAFRHRKAEAFLQLSNDLSSVLQLPLLLSKEIDYPKAFKKRIAKASQVVASINPNALLLIVIDAADNSIIAASSQTPPEESFLPNFLTIGELPENVRFVVTTRTGKLSSLNIPPNFFRIEVHGFSLEETTTNVFNKWSDAPQSWLEDFHHFSQGNPRVQQYALDFAEEDPSQALDYLRPNGKNLDRIFEEQLMYTLKKIGCEDELKAFCAAITALPRPIPIADLSEVSMMNESHINDICVDLAPGIRLMNGMISLSDEDFEQFIRDQGNEKIDQIRDKIADYFLSRHNSDPYAATNIADALFLSGRKEKIIELIHSGNEPESISDPIMRRRIQLKRLRIAMTVCREAGNTIDSILTILRGAEALKTEGIINQTIIEYIDLSANFAYESVNRIVLNNPKEIEKQGPLLFELMSLDARQEDNISVREGSRKIKSWMERRREHFEEQRREHPGNRPFGWTIDIRDIVSEIEALLRIHGPQKAVDALMRWRPKTIAVQVAIILSFKLIASGEKKLVKDCLEEAVIPGPWDSLLHIPLALSGDVVDISRLETNLNWFLRRRLINIENVQDSYDDDTFAILFQENLLTATEILIARGGDTRCIIPILEAYANKEIRKRDSIVISQAPLIDLSLRAYALLERISNKEPSLETYLIDTHPITEEEKKNAQEKSDELKAFIGPLVEIYDVRAQALLGIIPTDELMSQLEHAISQYDDQEYRIRRKYCVSAMRLRVALSITRLLITKGSDQNAILDCAISMLGSWATPFNSAVVKVIERFSLYHSMHDKIINKISTYAETAKQAQTSAEEKIKALMRFARLLFPISSDDAKCFFTDAINIAGDVNEEVIYELSLIKPFAQCASKNMSLSDKREVAKNLAIVINDAGIRLDGNNHFPWAESVYALASIDVCFALAAIARWHDSSIVDMEETLPSLLDAALTNQIITPSQATSLSFLLDNFDEELIFLILDQAKSNKNVLNKVIEHLSKEELLRFGRGNRNQVYNKLQSYLSEDTNGFWLDRLKKTTEFIKKNQIGEEDQPPISVREISNEECFNNIDWASHRFITTDEILDVISSVSTATKKSGAFISISKILDRIRDYVAPRDRAKHLEALSNLKSDRVFGDELVQAIVKCIDIWYTLSPAVRNWCSTHILQVIKDLILSIIQRYGSRQTVLQSLLNKSGATNQQICEALLETIELHVDSMNAYEVYAFVGEIGHYCTPSESEQIIKKYTKWLVNRIPDQDKEVWNPADIPDDIVSGLACFINALMGDIDVRIRWRAAHALRSLTGLGDTNTIKETITLYDKTNEESYRKLNAPFYWMAARLWLMIAIDRISGEVPSALNCCGHDLYKIACDNNFPHIIIRAYAKSAVLKLVHSGELVLDDAEIDLLEQVNQSPIDRKIKQRKYNDIRNSKNHRFHFDSMDTLPYWYSGAIDLFADISNEEFLTTAESWIIDHWCPNTEIWRWDEEPRKDRFSERSFSLVDHRHGSRPTLERFSTYLEWHAMWCSIGQIMQTRALAIYTEDYYDSFEAKLKRECLSIPPLWISDLRCPKPLEEKLWFTPHGNIKLWLDNVQNQDFFDELGLFSDNDLLAIGGYHDTRSSDFALITRINTALVSPKTAPALVRALQSANDSHDYRIPPEGDHLEINQSKYILKGWINDTDQDIRIDEGDPIRYEIRNIEQKPSSETINVLNLKFIFDGQVKWVNDQDICFIYETWSDIPNNDAVDRRYFDISVKSHGWRLKVTKDALDTFLNKVGFDLIIEVEITRRNKGDYEKETKKSRFTKLVLLRRDGTIEDAEGCIGAWKTPCS